MIHVTILGKQGSGKTRTLDLLARMPLFHGAAFVDEEAPRLPSCVETTFETQLCDDDLHAEIVWDGGERFARVWGEPDTLCGKVESFLRTVPQHKRHVQIDWEKAKIPRAKFDRHYDEIARARAAEPVKPPPHPIGLPSSWPVGLRVHSGGIPCVVTSTQQAHEGRSGAIIRSVDGQPIAKSKRGVEGTPSRLVWNDGYSAQYIEASPHVFDGDTRACSYCGYTQLELYRSHDGDLKPCIAPQIAEHYYRAKALNFGRPGGANAKQFIENVKSPIDPTKVEELATRWKSAIEDSIVAYGIPYPLLQQPGPMSEKLMQDRAEHRAAVRELLQPPKKTILRTRTHEIVHREELRPNEDGAAKVERAVERGEAAIRRKLREWPYGKELRHTAVNVPIGNAREGYVQFWFIDAPPERLP